MTTRAKRSRRVAAIALGAAVAFGSHSAPATAAGSQVVEGEIFVASGPRAVGPVWVDACGPVAATTGWAARRSKEMYVEFAVDPTTRGRAFVLSASMPADLDIAFHGGSDHRMFGAHGLDAERGRVPAGAVSASVCLAAGPPTGFTYRAG